MISIVHFLAICCLIFVMSNSCVNGFTFKSLSLNTKVNHVQTVQRYDYKSFAVKKDDKPEVANEYWQGDWVCADCGYVYDKDIDGGGLYFEQQKKGFICPQCSAPRRRYAKKVGDKWGVTNDGGDLPIYAVTFVGLALTTWFALVYVPTL